MPLVKVLARGQVTLPGEIRRKAGIKPGDVANVKILGPGVLKLTVLPNLSPRQLRERCPIDGPVDGATDPETWQDSAARDALADE